MTVEGASCYRNAPYRRIPPHDEHTPATMEELVIGKDLSWMDSFPAVHEPEVEYVVQKKKKRRPNKCVERTR